MNIVAEFNPATLASDMFTVPTSSASGKMVIWNESSISLQLTFQNGNTTYVPAWVGTIYPSPPGNVNVTWEQHSVLVSSNPPLSMVVIELYDSGECVPERFPIGLFRQHNIGNTVGTV